MVVIYGGYGGCDGYGMVVIATVAMVAITNGPIIVMECYLCLEPTGTAPK